MTLSVVEVKKKNAILHCKERPFLPRKAKALLLVKHLVHNPVRERFVGAHEVVAIGIERDF